MRPTLSRLAIASAVAFAAIGSGAAAAPVGDLSYRDCLSGDVDINTCISIPGATADGGESGLSISNGAETSPDGRSLYTVSSSDDAIAHFRRDRSTGELSYQGCISGETESSACDQLASAEPGGEGSGLDRPESLAISVDGRSVYVTASGDDAVTIFERNRQTGALRDGGCISGDTAVTACTQLADAQPGGANSGLSGPEAVGLSPDGRLLYVLSYGTAAVADFKRDRQTGALTYIGCLGADSDGACELIPGAVAGGSNTGFDSLQAMAISPDGRSLYTVSDSDEAVAEFRLGGSGALSFRRCITGATMITNCVPIPGATPNGSGSGLRSLIDVAISPDGNSVYTVGDSDEAIARFDRARSGRLSFRGCLTGESNLVACTAIAGATASGANSGMDYIYRVGVAPDARTVYLTSADDDAMVSLARTPRSGALAFQGCLSAETESAGCDQLPGAAAGGTGTGFDRPAAVAPSPDGESLYATSSADTSVARFDREPDRRGPKLALKANGKGSKVVARVTCRDEFCAKLIAKGKLKAGGRAFGLGSATEKDVWAGEQAKLVLRARGKAADALREAGEADVKLKVSGRDLLGNSSRQRASVTLHG